MMHGQENIKFIQRDTRYQNTQHVKTGAFHLP